MLALAWLGPAPASATLLPPQIHTVAGGGSCAGALTSGGPCDGVKATSVPIGGPRSVAALPGGGYLYIDSTNDLVREVSASGVVTTVAGTSQLDQATQQQEPDTTDVDGVAAIDSGLDDPVSVAALPSGGFLITEYAGSRVRLVSPGAPGQATITTIAGIPPSASNNGQPDPGDNGNSGPGTSVELNFPADAEPTAGGGVLIADTYNHRIMLLSAMDGTGTIQEIAGGGSCENSSATCDGLEAGGVGLYLPDSVSEIPNGSGAYVFADYGADTVDQVSAESASGTFDTVVGQPGSPGYSGDGGPATAAQLDAPEQVVAQADGSLLVSDSGNSVVREVSPSGAMSTIAGDGLASFAGDGGDATAASLSGAASVSPLSNGNILIADENNNRIREITAPPTSYIYLDPLAPNGANGWYTVDPLVSVGANQAASVSCVIDPAQAPPSYGAINPGCSPFDATGNGTHTLWAAAQNSFGDQENPISATFKIDVGAPTVTCPARQVFQYGATSDQVAGTLSDSVSGPASEPLVEPADTHKIGAQHVTLSGTNNAGTAGSSACAYFVTVRTFNPMPAGSARLAPSAGGQNEATISRLRIAHIPAWAELRVRCSGAGCPAGTSRGVIALRALKGRAAKHKRLRSADLAAVFGGARLAYGAVISAWVTGPETVGRYLRFTIGAGSQAKISVACLEPGSLRPGRGSCVPKDAVP